MVEISAQTTNNSSGDGRAESMTDIRTFAKVTLKNRIFLGNFQEKRYVPKLNTYKDVVVLDKNEKVLCDDFVRVRNRVLNCDPNVWIGFSAPADVSVPTAHCIWTTLDEENPVIRDKSSLTSTISTSDSNTIVFGEYWFQIKTLLFGTNAIEIQLKILRPVDSIVTSTSPISSTFTQQALEFDPSVIQQYVQENIMNVDWWGLLHRWKVSLNQILYRFASEQINLPNFIHCVGFVGAFCIGSVNALIHFIHYLGEFTLKLIYQITKLIQTLTPIVLALVNLVAKTIGGLYILLAMIWRDMFDGGNRQRGNNNSNNFGGFRSTNNFQPIQMARPTTDQTYRYRH